MVLAKSELQVNNPADEWINYTDINLELGHREVFYGTDIAISTLEAIGAKYIEAGWQVRLKTKTNHGWWFLGDRPITYKYLVFS